MKTFPERETIRQIANTTIQHMELLKQALESADFHESRFNEMASIVERTASDLEFAKERISQDESTIQILNGQISALQGEKLELQETWTNQKLMLNEKDDTIHTLRNEIEKLKKELGVETTA